MKLEIIDEGKLSLVSEKFLKDCVDFFEKSLVREKVLPSPFNKKLTLAFVSREKIQDLNRGFLKKDSVTDVLSFSPLSEDSFGELALCAEKIQAQAFSHGLSLEEETAYLILHGLLHLLGYEHEKGGAPARKMYKIQDLIFEEWRLLGERGK